MSQPSKPKPRGRIAVPADPKPPTQPVLAPPADPFATAPHQVGLPKMPVLKHGFHEVVRDLYAEGYDPVQEVQGILGALKIEGALTPGALQAAANRQEDVAIAASRLRIVAKMEVDAYLRECDVVEGAMREAASATLELEKKSGERTKMITDGDVLGEMARHYPDEYRAVHDGRVRAKGMLTHLETVADTALSRCRTVASMLRPSGKL